MGEMRIIGITPKGHDYKLECPIGMKEVLLSDCVECNRNRGFNLREQIILCGDKKNVDSNQKNKNI
jgi:hypothetical protein